MNIDWFPLINYVLIATFTPGPNNITSASMAIQSGMKKTLRYIAGIAIGFILIMLTCATLSTVLSDIIKTYEQYIRYVGAAYILWLAFSILTYKYGENEKKEDHSMQKGFWLQLVNPKVAVYGMTLYSSFLAKESDNFPLLIAMAFFFTFMSFTSCVTWALCGTGIRKYLKSDRFRIALNIILCLLLVYTAIDLSGLINL